MPVIPLATPENITVGSKTMYLVLIGAVGGVRKDNKRGEVDHDYFKGQTVEESALGGNHVQYMLQGWVEQI